VDWLDRLSWQVLLQALADAPKEKYSAPAVLAGLRPWALIVSLPLDRLEATYVAAKAGTLDLGRIRDVPRSDKAARAWLQAMGQPMRREVWGLAPKLTGTGRKTWAENMRNWQGPRGPAPVRG
jgi:hypothetical protein